MLVMRCIPKLSVGVSNRKDNIGCGSGEPEAGRAGGGEFDARAGKWAAIEPRFCPSPVNRWRNTLRWESSNRHEFGVYGGPNTLVLHRRRTHAYRWVVLTADDLA
jgi:hypothetical protein